MMDIQSKPMNALAGVDADSLYLVGQTAGKKVANAFNDYGYPMVGNSITRESIPSGKQNSATSQALALISM